MKVLSGGFSSFDAPQHLVDRFHRTARLPERWRQHRDVVHEADVEQAGRLHPPVQFVQEERPDRRAQRTPQRDARLVLPERAAPLGRPPGSAPRRGAGTYSSG